MYNTLEKFLTWLGLKEDVKKEVTWYEILTSPELLVLRTIMVLLVVTFVYFAQYNARKVYRLYEEMKMEEKLAEVLRQYRLVMIRESILIYLHCGNDGGDGDGGLYPQTWVTKLRDFIYDLESSEDKSEILTKGQFDRTKQIVTKFTGGAIEVVILEDMDVADTLEILNFLLDNLEQINPDRKVNLLKISDLKKALQTLDSMISNVHKSPSNQEIKEKLREIEKNLIEIEAGIENRSESSLSVPTSVEVGIDVVSISSGADGDDECDD